MAAPAAPRLSSFLKDEVTALREFVRILQREQEALSSGDVEGLISLVADKTRLSGRLANYADQRNEILMASALPADRSGMETWLAAQGPESQASRKDWEDLLALAAEARALNETNGKLIATHLQHNQQALNTLLAASNQAALYGPDGQTHASGSGRLFGAA